MEGIQRNAKEREPHPLDKNFFSKLFFCWFPPFIIRGFKNEIDEDNLYMTNKNLTSEYLSKKLEIAWDKELKKSKPSLLRALLSVFKCDLLCSAAWRLFLDMLKLSQPILIALLVSYFQSNQKGVNLSKIYICSALLISAATCQIIAIHQNMLLVLTLGMKIRIATCALIYKKSLRLSKTVLEDTKTGHIINLMSNDVGRFDVCCQFIHLLWLAPLEIAVVMILLYLNVSWTGLVGCVFLLAFIPFQPYMAKLASEYRLRTALCTDERVRLMNDILSGIQVIKMYTWEEPFALLVDRIRKLEVKQIQHISTIRAIMLFFSTVLSRLAVFICVFTFILSGFSLTAYFVFTVVSFYAFLRNSVILLFPQAVIQAAEAKISISRIEKFLLTEEIENDFKQMSGDTLDRMSVETVNEDIGILIKNAAVKFMVSSPENIFKDVNFEAASNQLVGLIGPVGGGKSTLLHVILKEVVPFRGQVEVNGSVSYAAQEPWIFGGSIRQNIIFGQIFNAEKYLNVVRVCALDRDLSMLPYGDRTIVGERGVNLSGGQKARVNLARAVYKDADIYLLDDPLSAVDILVGNQLFHNCIRGYLKNKCVVLVTHQVQYLNSASSIYLLEDGIIRSSSTFEMLESNNKTFKELLESSKVEEQKRDVYRIRSKILNINYESDQIPSVSAITKEERASGAISKQVYKSYFTAGGHWSKTLGVFTAFVSAQFFGSSADLFLTYWVNAEQIKEKSVFFHQYGLLFYTFLITAAVTLAITRAVTFFKYTLRSSTILHNNMFKKVLYSPLSFFNTNPSGRILNRFSKDVGSLDETLPLCLVDTLAIGLTVLGITVVISIVNPWVMLPTMLIFAVMFYIKKCFLKSSRNIKRVEAVTRSPIYTHLTASLQGITTIRAFGAEEILCKEFDTLQDNCSSASYMFLAASRGFGFWLDLNCVTYITLVIISLLFIQRESFGGNVGLSLTQAITLAGMFQWGIRQWSELENQMTSMERVQEYIELPTELDYHKIKPIPSWPESGHIIFKDVYLRYDPSSNYVLNDLNFEVRSGEKVGIVGRTGAGKSSIIQALFRLIDFEGFIIIDDLDTKTLKLKYLRSKISIIPQEPILFSGTLRKNLDPFGNYEDEVLWHVLEVVELKNAVDELPLGLDSKMIERGSNFSVGQRQLLCLARALVRNNKILVLDEATASVDAATDEIIQNTIREKFADCTVFTIAHRLHSIMDSDKILVMDSGRIVEFDHPYNLLKKGEGTFFRLVKETGKNMSSNLFSIAEENYLSKAEETVS